MRHASCYQASVWFYVLLPRFIHPQVESETFQNLGKLMDSLPQNKTTRDDKVKPDSTPLYSLFIFDVSSCSIHRVYEIIWGIASRFLWWSIRGSYFGNALKSVLKKDWKSRLNFICFGCLWGIMGSSTSCEWSEWCVREAQRSLWK